MENLKFNKQWAQSHSKADFIEQHKHLGEKSELSEAWEDLQAKKEEPVPKAKALPPGDDGKTI